MFGSCGNCACFLKPPAQPKIVGAPDAPGQCQWRPPTAVPMQVQGKATPGNPQGIAIGVQAVRPPVFESDGCGQWEGRSAANN